MKNLVGFFLGLFLSFSHVVAAENEMFFNVGVHYGGDAITISSTGSEFGLHEGFSFLFGMDIALTEMLFAEISGGYMIGFQNYSNGSASFSRIPLEALAVAQLGSVRIGAGITYHMSHSVETEFDGFTPTVNTASDAMGYVVILEVPTRSNENSAYGFKYTQISYEFPGVPTQDGSGIAFYGSLKF